MEKSDKGVDMMAQHTLKIVPTFFDAVKNGIKTFEIRKNDREFTVGDTLHLREYNPNLHTDIDAERFTGRSTNVVVTYVLSGTDFPDAIKDGYCIMGIRTIE